MPIQVQCGGCKRRYAVPDQFAGKKARCKKCGQSMVVPAAAGGDLVDLEEVEEADDSAVVSLAEVAEEEPAEASSADTDLASLASAVAMDQPAIPQAPPDMGGGPLSASPGGGPLYSGGGPLGPPVPAQSRQGLSTGIWMAIGGGGVALLALVVVLIMVLGGGSDDLVDTTVADGSNTPGRPTAPSTPVTIPSPSLSTGPAPPHKPPTPPRNPLLPSGGPVAGKPQAHTPRRPTLPMGSGFADSGTSAPVAWQAEPDPPAVTFEYFTGKKLSTPPLPANSQVVFPNTPSPYLLIVGQQGRNVALGLVDLQTGKDAGVIQGELERVRVPALSPDGRFVAAATDFWQKTVNVWSFETKELVYETTSADDGFKALYFAGPERLITVRMLHNVVELKVVDPAQGTEVRQLTFPSEGVNSENPLVVSPGGRYIAVPSKEVMFVYEPETGACVGQSKVGGSEKTNIREWDGLAFAPDGSELVGITNSRHKPRLVCWDFATGEVVVDEQMDRDPSSGVDGASRYQGPVIDWMPDKSGWIFRGHVLLDRGTVTPVWQFPATTEHPRKLLDASRMLVINQSGFGAPMTLGVASLPAENIAKAVEAVKAGGAGIDAALPPLTQPDVAGVEVLTVGEPSSWAYQADPAPTPAKLPQRPIQLGKEKGRIQAIRFSGDYQKFAVMRVVEDQPDSRWDLAYKGSGNVLERYDLGTGKRGRQTELPVAYELLHVNPDGSQALLALRPPQPPLRDRLDVWSLVDGNQVVGWRPYGNEAESKNREVKWAAFVDPALVLTVNPSGKLVLWQLPECKAVYVLDGVAPAAALSPGGRYLAVRVGEDATVSVLEAATGTCVGKVENPDTTPWQPQSFGFCRDGGALAMVTHTMLVTWDLTDGKRTSEGPHGGGVGSFEVAWRGDRHVLLGNRHLFDLSKDVVVWRYVTQMRSCHVAHGPDDRHWLCSYLNPTDLSGPYYLAALPMPSPTVKQMTADVRLEELAILYPGAKATVSGSVPGADSREITRELARKLEANGVIVDSRAPVRVSFTGHERGTGETLQVTRFGPGRDESFEHKVIECVLTISDSRGRKYESKSRVSMQSFGMVHGENAQKQLTESMRKGAASQAKSVYIPRYVFPGDGLGVGTSQLTLQGEMPVGQKEGAGRRPGGPPGRPSRYPGRSGYDGPGYEEY
ncbi:MAG: hypothetical protein ACYTG0_32575 [Planctomycetota bacterium]|jgi:hypothetical protein